MTRQRPTLGVLAALALGGVVAAATLSTIAGRDRGAVEPPPPAEAAVTSDATTEAPPGFATLPEPGQQYAQSVILTTGDDCGIFARSLGAPLYDARLDLAGLDGCTVTWSPDARYAAALTYISAVPTVALLDRADGSLRPVSKPIGTFQVPFLAVSSAGRVAACTDGLTTRLLPRGAPLRGCVPTFSANRLLVARPDGEIVDAAGRTVVSKVLLPPGPRVLAMAATGDGASVALLVGSGGRAYALLASLGGTGPVKLIDLGISAVAAEPAGAKEAGITVAHDGQGAFVHLGALRAAVSFVSGRVVHDAAGARLSAGAFSPDGDTVLLTTATASYLAETASLTPTSRAEFSAEAVFWPSQIA